MILGFFRKDSNYSDDWCIQSIRKTMDEIGCTEQNIFAEPCLYKFLDQCRKTGVKVDKVIVSSAFDLVPNDEINLLPLLVKTIGNLEQIEIPVVFDGFIQVYQSEHIPPFFPFQYNKATANQKALMQIIIMQEITLYKNRQYLRIEG